MISERDVIYVTKKQASIALVALAIFCILMFMLGYFWGKQCVLEGFGQRITQESMNDQADYESMMQSFADRIKPTAQEVTSDTADFSIDQDENSKIDLLRDDLPDISDHFETPQENSNDKQVTVVKPASDKNKVAQNSAANGKKNNNAASASVAKKWSALLVGFATKQSALNFVQRLANRGITVHIKTRLSKSANGKTKKMWFQIVTSSYNSKEELNEAIAQIKKTEHIKSSDIKIN